MTNIKQLTRLTYQILILRGGAGSGNWGHQGRPGRKGGSGRGGGLGFIGFKGTSGKVYEKTKGAEREARIKSIKETAAKFRQSREVGKVKVAPTKVKQAQAIIDTARQKRDTLLNQRREIVNKSVKLDSQIDELRKKQDKLFIKKDKLTYNPPGEGATRADWDKYYKKQDKLEEDISKTRTKLDKSLRERNELYETQRNLPSANIFHVYERETRGAYETVFSHNLNQAKDARAEMGTWSTQKAAEFEKLAAASDRAKRQVERGYKKLEKVEEEHGFGSPEWQKQYDSLDEPTKKAHEARDAFSKSLNETLDERIQQAVGVENPAKIKPRLTGLEPKEGREMEEFHRGVKNFETLVDQKALPPDLDVEFQGQAEIRASAGVRTVHYDPVYGKSSTIVHELGHVLEGNNPHVYRKAFEFLDRRTRGEEVTELFGDGSDEWTKKDKFTSDYMGKQYRNSRGQLYATEIVSMGLQMFATDPWKFAKEDPDYFDFIYAVTRSG